MAIVAAKACATASLDSTLVHWIYSSVVIHDRPAVTRSFAPDQRIDAPRSGAGEGEMVLFCQGSSARLAPGMKEAPVDAVIIGIVDSVDVFGKEIFSAKV